MPVINENSSPGCTCYECRFLRKARGANPFDTCAKPVTDKELAALVEHARWDGPVVPPELVPYLRRIYDDHKEIQRLNRIIGNVGDALNDRR